MEYLLGRPAVKTLDEIFEDDEPEDCYDDRPRSYWGHFCEDEELVPGVIALNRFRGMLVALDSLRLSSRLPLDYDYFAVASPHHWLDFAAWAVREPLIPFRDHHNLVRAQAFLSPKVFLSPHPATRQLQQLSLYALAGTNQEIFERIDRFLQSIVGPAYLGWSRLWWTDRRSYRRLPRPTDRAA